MFLATQLLERRALRLDKQVQSVATRSSKIPFRLSRFPVFSYEKLKDV